MKFYFATTVIATMAQVSLSYELNEHTLKHVKTAADLSDKAYLDEAELDTTPYQVHTFSTNQDQALVAKVDGTCYGAFRGTNMSNFDDVKQNFSWWRQTVCGGEGCCKFDRQLALAYGNSYKSAFENTLRACVATCKNKNNGPCPVVLTGHSQGGAIATVSAVALADLKPTLITFGQQAALRSSGCSPLSNSDKYLRFENSRTSFGQIGYDPVPPIPTFASHYGRQFMLGEGGLAVIGQDTRHKFGPGDFSDDVKVHRISSYIEHLNGISAGPVVGFTNGSACTTSVECAGECKSHGLCGHKSIRKMLRV